MYYIVRYIHKTDQKKKYKATPITKTEDLDSPPGFISFLLSSFIVAITCIAHIHWLYFIRTERYTHKIQIWMRWIWEQYASDKVNQSPCYRKNFIFKFSWLVKLAKFSRKFGHRYHERIWNWMKLKKKKHETKKS